MEVKLPGGSGICTLRSTWSELGPGKNTELSPGVFTLEVKESVNENRASVAAYRNLRESKFHSHVVIGKAQTSVVRQVFPDDVPVNAGNVITVGDATTKKFVTAFMETFSLRDFSDMNSILRNMVNIYKDQRDGLFKMQSTETTYKRVMNDEETLKVPRLRSLMSTATTSKLYNIKLADNAIFGPVYYQVLTTRIGKTLNIYLRQTQEFDFTEVYQHAKSALKAAFRPLLGMLPFGLLKWTSTSELGDLLQSINDYELQQDPLIADFLDEAVPLQYFAFAALVFSRLKDDIREFVDRYYEGGDIKIYGFSLGGGIGCALMCLIAFWKKTHTDDGRLRIKMSSLLVGQIELFTEKQSTAINSLMIKHRGRFQLFSVTNTYDYASYISSVIAFSGGLRIYLIDYSYPTGKRSAHSMETYIESMDRFYIRMSDISIGGSDTLYKDATVSNHVRAFASLPSSVLARGSTRVEMAAFKSIRNINPKNPFEVVIQRVLGKQKFNVVFARPAFFYFTDFTVNSGTAYVINASTSDAARIFIRSAVAEFQNRLIVGSVARNMLRGSGEVGGVIVVPVIERVYVGPAALFSLLYTGKSTDSLWNGYKTYTDQYGGTYILVKDLAVDIPIMDLELVDEPHRVKRKSPEISQNPGKDPMDVDVIDSQAIAVPNRGKRPAKRQRTRE